MWLWAIRLLRRRQGTHIEIRGGYCLLRYLGSFIASVDAELNWARLMTCIRESFIMTWHARSCVFCGLHGFSGSNLLHTLGTHYGHGHACWRCLAESDAWFGQFPDWVLEQWGWFICDDDYDWEPA